jgi:hypothetical protein
MKGDYSQPGVISGRYLEQIDLPSAYLGPVPPFVFYRRNRAALKHICTQPTGRQMQKRDSVAMNPASVVLGPEIEPGQLVPIGRISESVNGPYETTRHDISSLDRSL